MDQTHRLGTSRYACVFASGCIGDIAPGTYIEIQLSRSAAQATMQWPVSEAGGCVDWLRVGDRAGEPAGFVRKAWPPCVGVW